MGDEWWLIERWVMSSCHADADADVIFKIEGRSSLQSLEFTLKTKNIVLTLWTVKIVIMRWGNHSPWSIQDSCDRFLDQKDSAGCKCLPQWSTFRCIVFVSIFFVSLSKWKSPMFEQGGQWWTRYQPVSYKLESRYQICQIVQSFFTLAGVGGLNLDAFIMFTFG